VVSPRHCSLPEAGSEPPTRAGFSHVPPSRTSTPGCRVGRDRRGTEDDAAARNSPKGWRYWFALALFLGLAFEEIYDALAALNVLL
jgi:hypothetical protein